MSDLIEESSIFISASAFFLSQYVAVVEVCVEILCEYRLEIGKGWGF